MRTPWLAVVPLFVAAAAVAGDNNMQPDVGKAPPELQIKEWILSDGRTSYADMKGEVVLVKSWKTG